MKWFIRTLAVSFGLIFLAGCNTLGVGVHGPGAPAPREAGYKPHGPPPHAPAHGYRHKHGHNHELLYDTSIDAYIVVGIPETYFGNDLYLRLSTDGRWMVSAVLDGGWRVAVGNEVPYKLRKYKRDKHKKKKYKKKYQDD